MSSRALIRGLQAHAYEITEELPAASALTGRRKCNKSHRLRPGAATKAAPLAFPIPDTLTGAVSATVQTFLSWIAFFSVWRTSASELTQGKIAL